MTAIKTRGLTKRFGDTRALEDLDLTVEEGETYGFLGPNGAGKSTTINVLLDFTHPTEGEVEVLGFDAQEETQQVRERVGILPDGFELYDRLTGRQHLEFTIDSKDASDDPDRVAERVGIRDALDQKVSTYSKGMAQRLALGSALVGDPDLLILDEPTTGLDPNGAKEMREIIHEERQRGATVFFSSHILGQVEAVSDRVGILRDGELVAEDGIDELRATADLATTLEVTLDRVPDETRDTVESLSGVSRVQTDGNRVIVDCDGETKSTVIRTLESTGATVKDFSLEEASLEDLFMKYANERP